MTQTAKITSAPFHQYPGGGRREYKDESLGLIIGKVVEILSETPDADGDYFARYTHPDGSPSTTYLNKECLTMTPTADDFKPTADDFKPGDRVRVAADAETADGNGVYFGRETEGVVQAVPYTPPAEGDVRVVAEDRTGRELGQWVGAAYLTKLADAPAEEPLADWERELLGEFRTGDKVIVAANAKWTDGTVTSITADGQPREATIAHDFKDGDYRVRTESGLFVVGRRYLELAPADAKVDEPVVGRLAVGTDPSRSHDPEDGWLHYSEHEVEVAPADPFASLEVEVEAPVEVARFVEEETTAGEVLVRRAAKILREEGVGHDAADVLALARFLWEV